MTDIFTLGIKADTTDIDRGTDRLDKFADAADRTGKRTGQLRENINAVGRAIATFGTAVVTATSAMTVSAANSAREIENLARISNLTVEEFQRQAFAASTLGVEQEKLAQIFLDTQDRVGDFLRTGGGPLLDFFETVAPQIGVTADQFRGLSGPQALGLYIESLQRANLSQSEMAFFLEAVASDLTVLQPLFENNGQLLGELTDRADELNIVLDEMDISNLAELRRELGESVAVASAFSDILGATLAPFVTDIANRFNDAEKNADAFRETVLDIAEAGVVVAGVYADAGRVFEIAGQSIGIFAFAVEENLNTAEQRFELAFVNFRAFADGFDIFLAEGINSLSSAITERLQNAANSVIGFINDSIEAIEESGIGRLLEAEFSTIEEITITPAQIDTSGLEASRAEFQQRGRELEAELAESNNRITEAWQSVLDLLEQPLPSDQFDEWFDNIRGLIDEQKKLQEETKKTGTVAVTTAGSTAKAERDFYRDRVGTALSSFQEITRFAIGAVDEQSAAREKLHRLEQAFTVIEIALSLQKAGANALEAISSAFAAPFPINFASGAAMIAIMAGLGLFSGGASANAPSAQDIQATQGTGTIFGDSTAQSQSLLRAQERLEDLNVDQLAELRGIRDGITSLSQGISGLTRDIVARGGVGTFSGGLASHDFSGTFVGGILESTLGAIDPTGVVSALISGLSSTRQNIVDRGISFVSQSLGDIIENGVIEASAFFTVETTKRRLFGLIKSVSSDREFSEIDRELAESISSIFSNIGDTVIEAASSLGFTEVEITRRVSSGRGDFFDGLPAEVRRAFGEVTSVFVTETLSLEEALKRFVVDIGDVSFEGLSGEEIEEQLNAIFSQQADAIALFLVPAIAEFQQVGEGAFETLVRVAQEQAVFNDAIAQLGIDLSELNNVLQIQIAQSVIELTGGAEKFRDLTNTFFSEFFTQEEQIARLQNSLTEATEQLGLSMFSTREEFRGAVEAIDITTEEGQKLFAQLLELSPAFATLFDALDQGAKQFADSVRVVQDAAVSTANVAFRTLQQSVIAQQNEIRAGLTTELTSIREQFDAQREEVRAQAAARTELTQRQIGIVNERISALSSLVSTLETSLTNLVPLTREQALLAVQTATRTGQVLDEALGQAIGVLGNLQDTDFATALDFQTAQGENTRALEGLRMEAGGQLSAAERNVMLLEAQLGAIKSSSEAEIAELDRLQEEAEQAAIERAEAQISELQLIVDSAREQLDALLGIESGVTDLAVAQENFADALQLIAATQNEESVANAERIQILEDRIAELQQRIESGEGRPGGTVTQPGFRDNPAGGDVQDMLQLIAVQSAKTAKVLERWDVDGQPENRNVS